MLHPPILAHGGKQNFRNGPLHNCSACRAPAKRGFSRNARLFSAGRSASLFLVEFETLCWARSRVLWKLLASRRAAKSLALLGSARVVVLCPLGLALLPGQLSPGPSEAVTGEAVAMRLQSAWQAVQRCSLRARTCGWDLWQRAVCREGFHSFGAVVLRLQRLLAVDRCSFRNDRHIF